MQVDWQEQRVVDEQTLALRREIMEQLYELQKESPMAQRIWNADRSDATCMPRAREATYLRDRGWIAGSIGADGGLALRLTSEGRDEFESGTSRTATPTTAHDHEYAVLLELMQPLLRLLEASKAYLVCLGDDAGAEARLVRASHLPHFKAAVSEMAELWRTSEPAVIDENVRTAFANQTSQAIVTELEAIQGDAAQDWDDRVRVLNSLARHLDDAVRGALRNYQQGKHLPRPPSPISAEHDFMTAAIDEARKSLMEPNKTPLYVGAVVVKDGQIIARGFRGQHKLGEHAEFTTLERNLPNPGAAANATLYCTLEPCIVRNPPKSPCADWIQRHRIARVVIGVIDPNRRIRGGGVRMLRKAGIDVALFPHALANEIEAMNHAFEREHEQEAASNSTPSPPAQRDPLVLVAFSRGPTLYLQDGREPAILGLGLVAINIRTQPVFVDSAKLTIYGNGAGLITDRLVMPKVTLEPGKPTNVPFGSLDLSSSVAERLRKDGGSECISLTAHATLHLQGADRTSQDTRIELWALVVRELQPPGVRLGAKSGAEINIHGSKVGGDVVGGDKKG